MAHVSAKAQQDVLSTIQRVSPAVVLVELDKASTQRAPPGAPGPWGYTGRREREGKGRVCVAG